MPLHRRTPAAIASLVLLTMAIATIAGCPQPNGYTTRPAFPQADFEFMDGMHWIPGDPSHALVLTQRGVIWRVNTSDPAEEPAIFLDLRDRLIPQSGGEEGLLGLAFSPDYDNGGRFYVHFTGEGDVPIRPDGQARKSVISRFTAAGATADPRSEQILLELRQPHSNHNGGALAFGPDGYLYVAFGDGGSGGDPDGNGQNLGTLLGKILRIDVSGAGYAVPPDNPFVGTPGARPEIWAYGLRNPWRIAFDRANGALWAADVGKGRSRRSTSS
ncbi:MAG: PQQ-dependent sugar dehydrogenase [Chloroflexi bacterium]|nr:PQQ-dependent sugar dehydrogenase [Chloroflexota bacterium]